MVLFSLEAYRQKTANNLTPQHQYVPSSNLSSTPLQTRTPPSVRMSYNQKPQDRGVVNYYYTTKPYPARKPPENQYNKSPFYYVQNANQPPPNSNTNTYPTYIAPSISRYHFSNQNSNDVYNNRGGGARPGENINEPMNIQGSYKHL